jgi:hypothetical protein
VTGTKPRKFLAWDLIGLSMKSRNLDLEVEEELVSLQDSNILSCPKSIPLECNHKNTFLSYIINYNKMSIYLVIYL